METKRDWSGTGLVQYAVHYGVQVVLHSRQDRDLYEQKLNKKMFRVGVRSILSELLRQDRLVVSSDILPATPKTKELNEQIKID